MYMFIKRKYILLVKYVLDFKFDVIISIITKYYKSYKLFHYLRE